MDQVVDRMVHGLYALTEDEIGSVGRGVRGLSSLYNTVSAQTMRIMMWLCLLGHRGLGSIWADGICRMAEESQAWLLEKL